MKVALFEPNLFWDAKARAALAADGWTVVPAEAEDWTDVRAVVVGLYAPPKDLQAVLERARRNGLPVLGHAGHKEKELLALGGELGCERVISNGEFAHRLKTHLTALIGSSPGDGHKSDG